VTAPNADLAWRVLDHIDAHPEQHNQKSWVSRPDGADCGTAACFAGWTCLLSGDKPAWEFQADEETDRVTVDGRYDDHVAYRAAGLLGIYYHGAELNRGHLFDPENDRLRLGELVADIFGPRPDGGGQ
jgi:hypothetical protein